MKKVRSQQAWGTSNKTIARLLPQIERDLADNDTLTAIYDRYQDKILVGYRAFTRMVNQQLLSRSQNGQPGLLMKRPRRTRSDSRKAAGKVASPSEELSLGGMARAPAETPLPPRGSLEWKKIHGIPERKTEDEPYVARIPDRAFLYRVGPPEENE